ncbi:hypothetical protein ACWF9G_28995 [Nocardia sp. NPDC055029]
MAAVFAAFTIRVGSHGIDAAAIVTTVAFVVMLALNVWQLRDRPDQDWYEGRLSAPAFSSSNARASVMILAASTSSCAAIRIPPTPVSLGS